MTKRKRPRIIGYVVVDKAEGNRHVSEQVHEFEAEAARIADALNAHHNTNRFAPHPITAD